MSVVMIAPPARFFRLRPVASGAYVNERRNTKYSKMQNTRNKIKYERKQNARQNDEREVLVSTPTGGYVGERTKAAVDGRVAPRRAWEPAACQHGIFSNMKRYIICDQYNLRPMKR